MDTSVDRALYIVSSSVLCTEISDATSGCNERTGATDARMQAGHTSTKNTLYGSHGEAKLLFSLSPWWKYCQSDSAADTPALHWTLKGNPKTGMEYPKGCKARSLPWIAPGRHWIIFFWNHLMMWPHVLLWVKSEHSWTSANVDWSRKQYFWYPTLTGTCVFVDSAKSMYNSNRLVGGPCPQTRLFHHVRNLS